MPIGDISNYTHNNNFDQGRMLARNLPCTWDLQVWWKIHMCIKRWSCMVAHFKVHCCSKSTFVCAYFNAANVLRRRKILCCSQTRRCRFRNYAYEALVVHSNLLNILMHVAIKVHVILRRYVVLTWIRDNNEIVQCVTLWINTSQHLR